MIDSMKQFYKRNNQNIVKNILLRISLAVIFVALTSKIVNYVINDLIFKTPRPDLFIDEKSTNLIYLIFSNEGLIFFSSVVLILFLADLFCSKKV